VADSAYASRAGSYVVEGPEAPGVLLTRAGAYVVEGPVPIALVVSRAGAYVIEGPDWERGLPPPTPPEGRRHSLIIP